MKQVVVLFFCCTASTAIIAMQGSAQKKLSQRRKLDLAPVVIPKLVSYSEELRGKEHKRAERDERGEKTSVDFTQQYKDYVRRLLEDIKKLSNRLLADIAKFKDKKSLSPKETDWFIKLNALQSQLADRVQQWNERGVIPPELKLTKEQLWAHLKKMECFNSQTIFETFCDEYNKKSQREAWYDARFEPLSKKK